MTNDQNGKPPYRSLLGSFGSPPPLWDGLNAPSHPKPTESLASLSGLFGSSPRPQSASLASLFGGTPTPAVGLLSGLGQHGQTSPARTKRRAFFSFHYADVMRVNNVRKSGEFRTASQATGRDVEGFYDGSLWESRKRVGDEAIKTLIRDGVHNTSAVCVLAGSETWSRRWVRYEIARAVIEERGLLTVHINGLTHHSLRCAHARGPNPLDFMGVAAVPGIGLSGPTYFLYEFKNGGWHRYADYTQAVALPRWLVAPPLHMAKPLSTGAAHYDYVADNGHQNIGRWIDQAAIQAGR